MRSFWFHYNKPESKKRGRNVLTIHFGGKCWMVEHIDCYVPVRTRHRSQQPRCVLAGRGYIRIDDQTATISQA